MSKPLRLVYSKSSGVMNLSQVTCKMLSADSRASLSDFDRKMSRLQKYRPGVVSVIEKLVDDLLKEVS